MRNQSQAPSEHTSRESQSDNIKWLLHTHIVVVHGKKTVSMDIKPQNAVIQQVMHHAYAIGDTIIAFGSHNAKDSCSDDSFEMLSTMNTQMDKAGIESIAFTALIKAAEKLGYDDDFDIADRLERGSYQAYAKLLSSYVCESLLYHFITV